MNHQAHALLRRSSKEYPIGAEHYERIKEIGKGGNGTVRTCVRTDHLGSTAHGPRGQPMERLYH